MCENLLHMYDRRVFDWPPSDLKAITHQPTNQMKSLSCADSTEWCSVMAELFTCVSPAPKRCLPQHCARAQHAAVAPLSAARCPLQPG